MQKHTDKLGEMLNVFARPIMQCLFMQKFHNASAENMNGDIIVKSQYTNPGGLLTDSQSRAHMYQVSALAFETIHKQFKLHGYSAEIFCYWVKAPDISLQRNKQIKRC